MCEQRDRLLDYLYDEASPASRREIERHLEGCAECRAEFRAFRDVREDLLAWDVPNPPSVWKAFAPAPVVPWHRQVPAWAMAAAASLMFLLGTAGGFVYHNVVEARSQTISEGTYGTLVPPELAQPAPIDSKAIVALIREELAKENSGLTERVVPVNNTPGRVYQMDAKTEARLMDRVEALVNESHMKQASALSNYLFLVAQESERERKENGQMHSRMSAQLDQLEAQVKQLAAAQTTKGQ